MLNFKLYCESVSNHDKKVARLSDLNNKLNQYKHRWTDNPSKRMYDWVDEYNDAKQNHPEAWKAHCDKMKLSHGHDAYDCLA